MSKIFIVTSIKIFFFQKLSFLLTFVCEWNSGHGNTARIGQRCARGTIGGWETIGNTPPHRSEEKYQKKVVNHKVANHSISLYVPYIGQIHWLQWMNSEQNGWNTIETRIKNNRKRKEKQLNEWTMNVLPKSTKRHWQKWRGRRTLNQWYGSVDSTEFDWKINQIETTALVLILLSLYIHINEKDPNTCPNQFNTQSSTACIFILLSVLEDTLEVTQRGPPTCLQQIHMSRTSKVCAPPFPAVEIRLPLPRSGFETRTTAEPNTPQTNQTRW
jgi:hypothetical protein